jgi:hypothetical protein
MLPNTVISNPNHALLSFADAHLDVDYPDRELMNRNTGTMNILPNTSLSTYTHETLHLMQAIFGQNLFYTHGLWITDRINNEQLQSMQSLFPNLTYGDNEFAYKDSVDDPYTLKYYVADKNNIPTTEEVIRRNDFQYFAEIHSMAFTDLHKLYERKDRELLEHTLFSMFMLNSDEDVVNQFHALWDAVIKLNRQ